MPAAVDPKRAAIALTAGLAVIALLLVVWWPIGVAAGVAAGALAVAAIGLRQQVLADRQPQDETLAVQLGVADAPAEEGVRGDLDRLKSELGDDYPDFARAARLVVETQYASAARLQRELQVPYSRARRLLTELEGEHFVGPATGSLPRVVLLPKEHLPEVQRLFADA